MPAENLLNTNRADELPISQVSAFGAIMGLQDYLQSTTSSPLVEITSSQGEKLWVKIHMGVSERSVMVGRTENGRDQVVETFPTSELQWVATKYKRWTVPGVPVQPYGEEDSTSSEEDSGTGDGGWAPSPALLAIAGLTILAVVGLLAFRLR